MAGWRGRRHLPGASMMGWIGCMGSRAKLSRELGRIKLSFFMIVVV